MPWRPLFTAWLCLWTVLLVATTASAAASAPAKPHQGTAEFSAALSIWLHADATARRHTGNAETTTARASVSPHAARGLPAAVRIPAGNLKAGMEHILRRHAFNTVTTKPASKFAQGMGHIEIRAAINEAVQSGASWQVQGGSRVLETSLGRTIGTDLAGNATSGIRVVTDSGGSVITAYPIPIP